MLRHTLMAFVLGSLMVPAALAADAIEISGEMPPNKVAVTVREAKVADVLDRLRERYGFEVSGLENTARGEALTMTISGSLSTVLERLLRNWNHMIVRSSGDNGGIAKVMILNAEYGAAPQRSPAARVGGDPLMQATSPGA